ncbi:hypothetical protein JL721_9942 [Aureococcus anophagefferens]|nr:hypothetical protein JL721_9942 [Aureococcus anophagefferens]
MCDKASIREPFVQRGTTCLDAGVYAANWLGCGRCGSSALPAAANLRVEEEEDSDDGEAAEETEFEHRCRDCNALVATHFHRFVAGPLARRWLMECALCGRSADERAALAAREPDGLVAAEPVVDDDDAEATGAPSRSPEEHRSLALAALDGATRDARRAAASSLARDTLARFADAYAGDDAGGVAAAKTARGWRACAAEFERYVAYHFEVACGHLDALGTPRSLDVLVRVADRPMLLRPCALFCVKRLVDVVFHYPGGSAHLGAPPLFAAAWRIIDPWLDDATRGIVRFVADADAGATPKGSTSGASGGAARSAKSNPFGAARTREEVLASKGIDAKAIDAKLDERTKRAPRLTKQQEEEMEAATTEVKYEEAQANIDKEKRFAAKDAKAGKDGKPGRPQFIRRPKRRASAEEQGGGGGGGDADRDAAFSSFNQRSRGGGSYARGGDDAAFQSFGGGGGRRQAAEGCKLYVGNISFDMTQQDLNGLFGPYGRSRTPSSRRSARRRPRGFAFVTFSSPAEAQAAIADLDGKEIDGRALRVNVSDPGGGGGGGYSGGGGGGGGRRGGGGGGGGGDVDFSSRRRPPRPRGPYDRGGGGGGYQRNDDAFQSFGGGRGGGGRRQAAEGCKLFVGNISYDMTQGDLDQIFGPYGQLTDTFLPTERETGRPRGFAFVTFSSPAEAQAAIAAVDGQDIDGRALRVNLSDGGGGGGGGGGGY